MNVAQAPPEGSIIDVGRRLLPRALTDAAKREPNKPWAFAFEDKDTSKGFRSITVGDVERAVDSTAWWILGRLGSSTNFETLAYIGVSDMRYQIVHLASIKCGYKVSSMEFQVLCSAAYHCYSSCAYQSEILMPAIFRCWKTRPAKSSCAPLSSLQRDVTSRVLCRSFNLKSSLAFTR